MFINYSLKRSLWHLTDSSEKHKEQKTKSKGFVLTVLMLLFAVLGIQAQTTRIGNSIGGSSVADGTFSTGATFAANGWNVANEGTGIIKWNVGTSVSDTSLSTTQTGNTVLSGYAVTLTATNYNIAIGQLVTGPGIPNNTYVSNIAGTALTLTQPASATGTGVTLIFGTLASNITGNAAYPSFDNGVTYSTTGFGARTVYFYKDIPTSASEKNMMLTFDWLSGSNTWQVYAVPTSSIPVGSDASTTLTAAIAGATPIIFSNTNTTTQTATGFIPPSFATGSPFRLIFVWSNPGGGGSTSPIAIDNISLVSRAGGQTRLTAATGLFTNASTWAGGIVPSPADDIQIEAGHVVTIDDKANLGAENVYYNGNNGKMQFGFFSDQFTINNDLFIAGAGSQFNVFEPSGVTSTPAGTGKRLKVGHDISITGGGRLDVSFGTAFAPFLGELILNGTTLQTISTDVSSFLGNTAKTNATTNAFGVINVLTIANTSTATPNIDWQLNNVRIKNRLDLTSGRVKLNSNKIILGNFGVLSATNFVCPLGNGFIGGIVSRWTTTTAIPSSGSIDAGLDYNAASTTLYPFLSATGQNRWAHLLTSTATVAGEIGITYTDATGMTSVSITDGITVGSRFNGKWDITRPDSRADTTVSTAAAFTFTSSTTANSLGLYATGAFAPNDGSSRIVYVGTALAGNHINGTTTPFIARSGLSLANLTSDSLYVGAATTSIQGAVTKTSAVVSGDWNDSATWSPSGVPGCGDVVTITAGHTITVNTTPTTGVAGITINAGGTLVNAGGTLTVGCTNNNAIFTNFGINTVSGGTLLVNGAVYHKLGSTFNQSSGDVTIDSNNAGNATTSVGQGGSSMKLDTSNLSLTGGKITIVDPLVNNVVSGTTTTSTNYTATTAINYAKNVADEVPSGVTSINMKTLNSTPLLYAAGQVVTGLNIPANTLVTSVTSNLQGSSITIGISNPTTGIIPSDTALTFSSMSNNCATIHIPIAQVNKDLITIGQVVSGTGIQPGTTVTSRFADNLGIAGSVLTVGLSLPITGLAASPIIAGQVITFAAASPGCSSIILPSPQPLLAVGSAITGTGIGPDTTISNINTYGSFVKVDLSTPTIAGIVAPVTITVYGGNLNSYAFAYNAPASYVSGVNHTLQIGNSTSSDKGTITTNGFLCNFIQGGGTLHLGNLTIDAPIDGTNRFFNVTNILSVQKDLTITAGSVFKKTNATGGMFFGGNVTNNGSLFMATSTTTNLANAALGATDLPQTISGSGFYNNLTVATANASLVSFFVNNSSNGGVTINVPNFRVSNTITLTAGIVHTSSTYPLYHGLADLSGTPVLTGGSSNTCHIDGPYVRSFIPASLSTNFVRMPMGKNGVYLPISLAVGNGGIFSAEAFTTNAGSTTPNASNLSAQRWKVSRVGTAGTFTNLNVSLGSDSITANNIVVQATTDEGADYDNVSGTTATFTAGTPNVIATSIPISSASFTGNFAYATTANCTSVNPGNTIADLTIRNIVTQQNCNGTNGILSNSTTITLNAVSNALLVPGLIVTGEGIAPGTTIVNVITTSSPPSFVISQLPLASSGSNLILLTFSSVENPTTVCGSPVTLSLQFPGTANGLSYQWQSSPDANVANYTNIAGATGATYVALPNATTYYRCNVTCVNGPTTTASTGVLVTFSNPSTVLTTTDGVTCTASTPVTVSATATAGTMPVWYAAATGGIPLAYTASYISSPATTTTYYVTGEKTYTSARPYSGTLTSTNNFSGVVFNALRNVRINSVKVHPRQVAGAPDAGAPMTIKLFKDGVQVPGTAAVTFTPVTNTAIATSPAIFNIVDLNYDIPAGNGYKLMITSGLSTTNLLGRFSTSVAVPAGVGSIGITAGTSGFETTDAIHYNFFDWNVTDICVTPRTPVVANVGCPQVNLKLFIEGYYDGASTMKPVKNNQDYVSPLTDVDNIIVELRDASSPHNLVATTTAVLKTNGDALATIPVLAGTYYIAVKHRNALETWSATAQTVGAVPLTYDFSTAANKAFGDNMKDLGSGIFGLYSGDINQDGFIESLDFPPLFNDSDAFSEGVFTTDLNGDGFVESLDFPLLFNNSDNFIEIYRPY